MLAMAKHPCPAHRRMSRNKYLAMAARNADGICLAMAVRPADGICLAMAARTADGICLAMAARPADGILHFES